MPAQTLISKHRGKTVTSDLLFVTIQQVFAILCFGVALTPILLNGQLPPGTEGPPLRILSFDISSDKKPILRWQSEKGVQYRVETTGRLPGASWNPVDSVFTAQGNQSLWTSPNSISGSAEFFRIARIPSSFQSGVTFTNPGPGGGRFLMSIAIHPVDPDIF